MSSKVNITIYYGSRIEGFFGPQTNNLSIDHIEKTLPSYLNSIRCWIWIIKTVLSSVVKIWNSKRQILLLNAKDVIFDYISYTTTRPNIDLSNNLDKTKNWPNSQNESEEVTLDKKGKNFRIDGWRLDESIPDSLRSDEDLSDKVRSWNTWQNKREIKHGN